METGGRDLYNGNDQFIMKVADDSIERKNNRVEAIINFAKHAGYTKIGIASCISFEKEAESLKLLLQDEGFDVCKVHCKHGKIPLGEILPGYKGVACNPAGQAKVLEENNTEMNIVMGLCVGHDMIFNQKSKVPVTNLIVKDKVLNHNSIEHFKQTK